MVIFRYAALLITIFILSSPQCSGQVNNSITDMQKKNTLPPLTPIEAQVIEGKGTQVPFTGKYDADGIRTEIECARCGAHLGHVFTGEGFTSKDTRHCVNSISMIFVPDMKEPEAGQLQTAVFASGCFWGTGNWFSQMLRAYSASGMCAGGL